MMKRILIFTFALFISLSLSAQDNTIRLTVSGEGATKEEATANALRSAIEQAFGTFVSANTQILNDDIVKDEIATISSGNIQEYTELGCITMPDGHKSVSLSATVSIGNLISYAKSKGSSAEFAGAVFAMNMKMRKLNAENEKKAINHLLEQLDILARDMFRIEIGVKGEPIKIDLEKHEYRHLREKYTSQPYYVDLELKYEITPTYTSFHDLIIATLSSLSLSLDEVRQYSESGEDIYPLICFNKDFFRISTHPIDMRDEHETFFYRTDITRKIVSEIHQSYLKALLAMWEIYVTGIDEHIRFRIDIPTDDGMKGYGIAQNINNVSVKFPRPYVLNSLIALSSGREIIIKEPSFIQTINVAKVANGAGYQYFTEGFEVNHNDTAKPLSIRITFSEDDLANIRSFELRDSYKHTDSIVDSEKKIIENVAPAQVAVDSSNGEPIPFQLVEEKPSFQGGDINQFLKWVRENQIYPEIAKENGIQGRVTVRATINTDGSLTDIMVVRGVDPSLDKEAIRVVSQSPKWKPGKQGGKAVPVTYSFPITFQIR